MTAETHIVNESGDRLDHYLANKGLCTSRSEAAKLIKDEFVFVNDKHPKASYKVQENDQILVNKPAIKTNELVPKDLHLDILYEDKDLLVLNKPAGLVVHPGAGHYDDSLVHGLLHHCKDLSGIGGVERPGIVHRLDKGTSGVMVVAKNDQAHQSLSEQFKEKQVEKEYMALCLGAMAIPEQTLVNLMKRAETNRQKFVVNQRKGKEAITHVTVLKKGSRVSLASVKIETGRTHQIRVHLNYIGHSILGDETYGGTKKLHGFNEDEKQYIRDLGHPLLHSKRMEFTHPKTKELIKFEIDPPEDFKEAVEKFL